MMTTHAPQAEHVAFDAMCAQLDEYQALPTVRSSSPESTRDAEQDIEAQRGPLDGLILAGLVSP